MIAGQPVNLPRKPVKMEYEASLTAFEDGTFAAFIMKNGDEVGMGISAGPLDGALDLIRERLRALATEE